MTECTDKLCSNDAEYALWMDGLGQFSRARNPEDPNLDDGDLSPYICEDCLARYQEHHGGEFVRPEERLVTDGGEDEAPDPIWSWAFGETGDGTPVLTASSRQARHQFVLDETDLMFLRDAATDFLNDQEVEEPVTDGGRDGILLANDVENPDRMGDGRATDTGLPELNGFETSHDADGALSKVDVKVTLPAGGPHNSSERHTVVYRIEHRVATATTVGTRSDFHDPPANPRRFLTTLLAGNEAVTRLDAVDTVQDIDYLLGEVTGVEPKNGYEPIVSEPAEEIVADGGDD